MQVDVASINQSGTNRLGHEAHSSQGLWINTITKVRIQWIRASLWDPTWTAGALPIAVSDLSERRQGTHQWPFYNCPVPIRGFELSTLRTPWGNKTKFLPLSKQHLKYVDVTIKMLSLHIIWPSPWHSLFLTCYRFYITDLQYVSVGEYLRYQWQRHTSPK